MSETNEQLAQLDKILAAIIDDWYARVQAHYVTAEESRELGVEPEVKVFNEVGHHRIKFARKDDLDVTYGLGAEANNGEIRIVASVNNKSAHFDYDRFVERLEAHYWASRIEKPWTQPEVDHYAYGDLLRFEPRIGTSIEINLRKEKADIMRLVFAIEPGHRKMLFEKSELLRDLIENYCLFPLQRLYAEAYREQ